MQKGYLVCKSAFEKIQEFTVDKKSLEESKEKDKPAESRAKPKDDKNSVKVIRCPLTGDIIEKSKVRKVFFCWDCGFNGQLLYEYIF